MNKAVITIAEHLMGDATLVRSKKTSNNQLRLLHERQDAKAYLPAEQSGGIARNMPCPRKTPIHCSG
jgi:hypothetical protein